MKFGISRRAFVCGLPLSVAAQNKPPFKKAKPLPSLGEFTRFTDAVTENTVVRLTVPSSASVLPYARNRFISTRERLLLFSSDRTGHFTPFQIDLHTGVIKQIAEAANLNPRSMTFDRQEKAILYLAGDTLFETGLSHGNPRQIAEGVASFGSAADGSIYLVDSAGKLIRKDGANARNLGDSANDVWPQPNSAGCVFSRAGAGTEQEFYYVSADGITKASLLVSGLIREPFWDADGQSILFLRDVTTANGTVVAEIHGRSIHSSAAEYLVSPTSQFASFSPNSDASVFVGASRSRAQPNVILMLRSPAREMTLCEHRATHAADVSPVFSPDNRRIYFESDREGKPAIYSVNVELLVEPQ